MVLNLQGFKSVVGKGGSQNRTLRDECYPFVEMQLQYLLTTLSLDNTPDNHRTPTKCLFANIFDGKEAHTRIPMFNYLLNLPQYNNVKKYVYVGDLKNYFVWLKEII